MSIIKKSSTTKGKNKFQIGIAFKIIGLGVIIAILTGLTIGIALIQNSRYALRKYILEYNLAAADLSAHVAAAHIIGAEMTLRSFAMSQSLLGSIRAMDVTRTEFHLAQILEVNPVFDNAAVYTEMGIGWASALKELWPYRGGSVADREWFREILASKKPYFGTPVLSRGTGQPIATFGIPILDPLGQTQAVIAGGISLASLSDAIVGIGNNPNAMSSLLDSRNGGMVVAHTDRNRILKPVSADDPAQMKAISGGSGTMEVKRGGHAYLTAYAPVEGIPWVILVEEPVESAYAALQDTVTRAAITGSIVILLAAISAVALARTVIRPVRLLVEGTKEIGRGNLDYRIGKPGRDEIGALSFAFNSMAAELQKVTASRDELDREIAERESAQKTLRNTLADLERSNKELEQFAYVASHDLQEPLRMISSYTQLLERRYGESLDQDARVFIGYAVDGANRMQRLIQDLLAYSRITTRGREPERVDTDAALDDALANLQAGVTETGASIVREGMPAVFADPSQLIQLFQNLIGNALKFRRPGEPPLIRVGAVHGSGEGRFVTFSVKDNGIGIDKKYYNRLFIIFQRLHGRHEYPGTGIGLALCKRIVERHGGKIWLESEPGSGTTMYFTLPVEPVH